MAVPRETVGTGGSACLTACTALKEKIMDEYNPDNPNEQNRPSGGVLDESNIVRVPIDDRRPYSPENPKYPEKYKKNLEKGLPMMLCPECRHLGRHKVTQDDQPTAPGMSMIGGELCDICGGGETYEVAF